LILFISFHFISVFIKKPAGLLLSTEKSQKMAAQQAQHARKA